MTAIVSSSTRMPTAAKQYFTCTFISSPDVRLYFLPDDLYKKFLNAKSAHSSWTFFCARIGGMLGWSRDRVESKLGPRNRSFTIHGRECGAGRGNEVS